jgi:hypothetical protein
MTSEDPDRPWAFDDPWTVSHPDHPLIDDHSAAILEEAAVELTLVRSPMRLGDGLADLHAMVSLQAQLQAWIPLAVAAAHNQGHTSPEIACQLQVSASTARRRRHEYVSPARTRIRQSTISHRTRKRRMTDADAKHARRTRVYPRSEPQLCRPQSRHRKGANAISGPSPAAPTAENGRPRRWGAASRRPRSRLPHRSQNHHALRPGQSLPRPAPHPHSLHLHRRPAANRPRHSGRRPPTDGPLGIPPLDGHLI